MAALALATVRHVERRCDLPASVLDFIATLTPAQADEFAAWRTAKSQYDRLLDAYWDEIEKKRAGRRAKRGKHQILRYRRLRLDLPADLIRARASAPTSISSGRASLRRAGRSSRRRTKQSCRARRLPRRRAASTTASSRRASPSASSSVATPIEAISLGLAKEQVVRVYALETGGDGTADMQAGINPITKKGKPISSALGYAQLLHANTIGELVKHGDSFIKRLQRLQGQRPRPGPRRRAAAQDRLAAGHDPQRQVGARQWYRHVAFAQTSKGYGIHAINLDGDIGPWLQSLKLRGLKDFAARKGVTNLSGEEIEMMNLSGPATGLEMMQPVGLTAPTPNFFARRAYYVNKMVIDKTSAELLAEFTRRMDASSRKPGAVEFAEAFDDARQAKSCPGAETGPLAAAQNPPSGAVLHRTSAGCPSRMGGVRMGSHA